MRLGEVEVKLEAWLEELAGVLARKDLPDPDRENALRVQADVARALVAARDVEKSRKPDRRARALKELREALEALRVHVTVRVAARATAWVEMVDKAGPLLSVAEIDALLEYAEPEQVKAREAAAAAATPAASAKRVTLENGGHLEYGFTVSLLRFSTSRRDDEPARLRNYTPALEVIPPEFGFQFTYHPNTDPWRLKTSDRSGYQLMSAGGILLARVDGSNLERGGIALAATLGFFEDSIGLGAGFDLYRGIPVAGPDGAEAGATAHTGVLAWALARNGEVTPENVFVVLTLNLAGLAGRVAGEGK